MPITSWNDQNVIETVRRATMQGVVRGTEMVRTEALRLILQTTKSGRTYRTRGVIHRASAPGEPPASDTGRLVNSITTKYDQKTIAGRVEANTRYAEFLEYGTMKMAERPFMRPALANKRDEFLKSVEAAIAAALK